MAQIRHTFKRLLSKSYREQRRMERDIKIYLSALLPCHQFVLIAAPEFEECEYDCGIIVPASKLLALYREEVEQTTLCSWDGKVMRRALPLWLAQASINDGEVTSLPRDAFRDIRGSISDWVKADRVHVWCYFCGNWVTGIAITKKDESQIGNFSYAWTDLWHCSKGHKLHDSRQELRRFFRKSLNGS